MRPLNPRESRLVAVAILIAVAAVIWLGVMGPILTGFAGRADERARLNQRLALNARMIAAMPMWRAEAQRQRRTADRFSIDAPSEHLAAEALKARVQQLATDEGFNVAEVQEQEGAAGPGEVRLRADVELTLTQLCDSLRRLQSQGALVVVDYISISADRALASGHEAPLDVRLELTGAYRPSNLAAS